MMVRAPSCLMKASERCRGDRRLGKAALRVSRSRVWHMRLAEFIETEREAILVEWEEFARTCAPASGVMDIVALRDHASEMLTVIADDLQTPQGTHAQTQKSKGMAPDDASAEATAAEEHGAGRAES